MTTSANGRLISKSSGVTIGLLLALVGGVILVVAAWKDLAHGQEDLRQELERTVKAIQASRWCELDDKMFMETFARQNSLTMPPHERVRGHNRLGMPDTH